MKVCVDIAAALKYLHGKNIIYRDLKPQNFGFDVRGNIKLFDFGLAKELNSCQREQDGTYHLTGGTGSLRYMAPEVVQHGTYNLSADVYSFCIMLWEILTLETPFEGFSQEKHANLVVYGTLRPKIDKTLPEAIESLLEDGWSSNLFDRPSFDTIFKTLSDISKLHINYKRRRSAYTLDKYSTS